MKSLNEAYRERIGLPLNEELTVNHLNEVLEKTARALPFENFRIINKTSLPVSKENLQFKILEQGEGGLCYELNPLLYYFLLDNGFNVSLVRGEVYNAEKEEWSDTGRTHAAVLLHDQSQDYLMDVGFGGNLPLTLVPMSGEPVTSCNGEYKVSPLDTDYGDHVLEVKVRDKDAERKIGYAFSAKPLVEIDEEMNDIQHLIETHEKSKFNKDPLAVQLLLEGSHTLTASSYTKWQNGEKTKDTIQEGEFVRLAGERFGLVWKGGASN
ncbi:MULTISPECIES: arylamine N-acetyltransferase family protein [Pontibacillus]|uniref:Arylamine N-acetyltransferase n=1 Tax=Pontibacillus chungwhensis TaxID=265426 RepID=A0ABY8V062_9BACI|nr:MULTISPECIES: arylamine N-acetyltransferase [Pontibacillus]MCD5324369.1 arylamine N-acetyltransferase [Pontibacillus sp. HN14]WIF99332.1 arylamine N-acetyltransferase [Pontibacillus chungwhensis]